MGQMKKITIFVMDVDSSEDFDRVEAWLEKWKNLVIIDDYCGGGWEHYWDVEAPVEAIIEIPKEWLCSSVWATPEIFNKP
ncbi:hypothetical protein [Acinetobacter sp. TUM15071]|uniref:hypothetical protein n=1 Tax=Acinetobacter sp. TUM15071 TaxID=2609135 RepID=UPI00124CB4B3|nr:hypothetical protein [Acinetobacter sp. TUM15071]